MRCRTYGYLPSCRVSPPLGRYQIIVLGDGGLAWNCYLIAIQPGIEPTTALSQVRCPKRYATKPTKLHYQHISMTTTTTFVFVELVNSFSTVKLGNVT